MSKLELKIPPPVVFLILTGGMWWVAGIPDTDTMLHAACVWLASPFILVGGICGSHALWAFVRMDTSIDPHRPEKATHLVVTGIYRYTRNPMYLGLQLALVAWMIVLAAPITLIGPILFVVYITRFQIIPEERILAERFGDEYAAYCQKVGRWL